MTKWTERISKRVSVFAVKVTGWWKGPVPAQFPQSCQADQRHRFPVQPQHQASNCVNLMDYCLGVLWIWTFSFHAASVNSCSFNCPFNVLHCFMTVVIEFHFGSCVTSAPCQTNYFQSKATNSASNCSVLSCGALLSDNSNIQQWMRTRQVIVI